MTSSLKAMHSPNKNLGIYDMPRFRSLIRLYCLTVILQLIYPVPPLKAIGRLA